MNELLRYIRYLACMILIGCLISCSTNVTPQYYPQSDNQIIGHVDSILTSSTAPLKSRIILRIHQNGQEGVLILRIDDSTPIFLDKQGTISVVSITELHIGDQIAVYEQSMPSASLSYPKVIAVIEVIVIR